MRRCRRRRRNAAYATERCSWRRPFLRARLAARPFAISSVYTLPPVPLTVMGIRHGEVHNPGGVIYAGLEGYGLSDLGRRQADAVAGALGRTEVDALYSSPLDRAMQTARPLADALGIEIRPDDRLYEWKYWQQWAGMTWEDLRTKGREAWEAYQSDPGSVTSGESLSELAERVESWMGDVAHDHDGLVVAVTHLEPLRAILLRLLGRPATDLFGIEIGLGHAVRLAPDPDPMALDAAALGDVVDASGGH
jgi:broad specificity phosphatase PhoE